jgi:DNA-binding transcriptional LysR family regulator
MTLDALKCFCALVETGSFRAAAERVFRSQPAVSQQMRSLEQEVGHTLVDRRTGRATAQGEVLYGRARDILRAMEALQRELADHDAGPAGELRLGTSDTTAMYLLPPYVRRFAEGLPQARLAVTNRSSDAIAAQVVRGELDLGIVTLPQNHADLAEEPLFQQRLRLVVPRGHRLAKRKSATLEDLRDMPILMLDNRTRTGALLGEFFRRTGFTPTVFLDSGSFEVIKRYIAEGTGVSFLPETVMGVHDSELVAVPMEGLPEITIGVIWRRDAYLGRAARAFLELLREGR